LLVGSTIRRYDFSSLYSITSSPMEQQGQQCEEHLWETTQNCSRAAAISTVRPSSANSILRRRASELFGAVMNDQGILKKHFN